MSTLLSGLEVHSIPFFKNELLHMTKWQNLRLIRARIKISDTFWRASNVLDAAIAIAILSVSPSVSHTSDPRLNGSKYRDMIYTARCVDA